MKFYQFLFKCLPFDEFRKDISQASFSCGTVLSILSSDVLFQNTIFEMLKIGIARTLNKYCKRSKEKLFQISHKAKVVNRIYCRYQAFLHIKDHVTCHLINSLYLMDVRMRCSLL